MNTIVLTEEQKTLLATSLEVAVDRYADNARIARPNHPHLAEQFDRQENVARKLRELIDNADSVAVIEEEG